MTPLEDAGNDPLDAFFDKLRRIEAGEAGLQARVIHYGDSHIAADIWTGNLRRRMQMRFGDAGHGFMLAGKPWRSYFHQDADNGVNQSRWWTVERTRTAHVVEDGLVGLGGVTFMSSKKGASVWMGTESDGPVGQTASRFEVFYLEQPNGGDFLAKLDGRTLQRVKTNGPETAPAYFATMAEDGAHTLTAEVVGNGQVRLFGFVFERDVSGVVYDSVGINGARGTVGLTWNADLWKLHLGHRDPDLLVTTYGTNEVDDGLNMDKYAEDLTTIVETMRAGAPNAACLILSPPDRALRVDPQVAETDAAAAARSRAAGHGDSRLWETPQQLVDIVETQRSVALELGCAFWSSYDAMGGAGSIDVWARDTPPLATRDRVHLTRDGYREIADRLFQSLMYAYDGRVVDLSTLESD